MSALQLAVKARAVPTSNPVARLYRSIIKEVPRVLIIYDIDIEVNEVIEKIRNSFYKNGHIQDARVKNMLVEKGYMELEETLLQYKQKNHVMHIINGYIDQTGADRKRINPNSSPWEVLARE